MSLREQMLEQFEQYGINIAGLDDREINDELSNQDADTLRNILVDLSDGSDFEIDGDEHMQGMVMSYALSRALENEQDTITAEDIDVAQQEMADVFGTTEEGSEEDTTVEPEVEASTETEEDTEETETVSKPSYKVLVSDYVTRFPEATKAEVVNALLEDYEHANPDTLTITYYTVRKEMGLAPNGKRGRPAGSGKLPLMIDKIKANPNMSRDDIIEWAVTDLELAKTTAENYYGKACKEL